MFLEKKIVVALERVSLETLSSAATESGISTWLTYYAVPLVSYRKSGLISW